MSSSESVVLGVVSGILTSIVLTLIASFFRSVFLPWYRQLIYKGIDISGEWYSTRKNPSGNIEESVLSIKQHADKVTCKMNIAKKLRKEKRTEIKTYELSGSLQDRFLTINGKNEDKQALGVHAELLEVVGDGKTFRGQSIWYSVTNKSIQAAEVEWTRK